MNKAEERAILRRLDDLLGEPITRTLHATRLVNEIREIIAPTPIPEVDIDPLVGFVVTPDKKRRRLIGTYTQVSGAQYQIEAKSMDELRGEARILWTQVRNMRKNLGMGDEGRPN